MWPTTRRLLTIRSATIATLAAAINCVSNTAFNPSHGEPLTLAATPPRLPPRTTTGSPSAAPSPRRSASRPRSMKNNYNAQMAAFNGGSTLTVQVGIERTHTVTFGTGAGETASKTALTARLGTYTATSTALQPVNDLVFTPTSTSAVTIGGTPGCVTGLFGLGLGGSTPTATVVTPSSTRSTLQTNFNNLLTQINQLASDSSYNGVNLLSCNNLMVDFNETNTSSLTIRRERQCRGLGLTSLNANEFQDNNSISTVVTATSILRSRLCMPRRRRSAPIRASSDPSVVRDGHLINTLQTGPATWCGGPKPGERQPAHPADPAATGNLRTVDRQPGEPVGAQAVPITLPEQASGETAGRKPRRFLFAAHGDVADGESGKTLALRAVHSDAISRQA